MEPNGYKYSLCDLISRYPLHPFSRCDLANMECQNENEPPIQCPTKRRISFDIAKSFDGWLREVEVQDEACMEQSATDYVMELNRKKSIRKATEEDCYFEGYTDAQELQLGLFQAAEEVTSSSQDTLGLVDPRPSSPLSVLVPNSSSPVRPNQVIKPLSKSERLERAVTAVKEGASAQQATVLYGVNRGTVKKRTEGAQS